MASREEPTRCHCLHYDNHFIYILSGYVARKEHNDKLRYVVNKNYRLDVSTFEMINLPKLTHNRHSIATVKVGDYLYAFGGVDAKGKASREIERLNITNSDLGEAWKKLEYKLQMDCSGWSEN